jgi:protein associated with RNAse G/E
MLRGGGAVPIAVRKYDGHRRFVVETTALAATPGLLVARGEAGRRFITTAETRRLPTITLEYFPAGRGYNILSYYEASSGALLYHFCNVLAGATWDGATLVYIDLDLDLRVAPTGRATVEDVGDFRRNARRWRYPAATRRGALAALREVRSLAARGVPPFTAESLAVATARAVAGEWAEWA